MSTLAVCGRCARDAHEKCLDRGYWDDPVGERQCACDCWRPPLIVAGEDWPDAADEDGTDLDTLCGLYGSVRELRAHRDRLVESHEAVKAVYVERDRLRAEKAHLIEINAALRTRPDLAERAPLVVALAKERDELRELVDRYAARGDALVVERDRFQSLLSMTVNWSDAIIKDNGKETSVRMSLLMGLASAVKLALRELEPDGSHG